MFQPAYRTKGGAFVVAPPPPCLAQLSNLALKFEQVIFYCFFYGLKHQATQPHISNLA